MRSRYVLLPLAFLFPFLTLSAATQHGDPPTAILAHGPTPGADLVVAQTVVDHDRVAAEIAHARREQAAKDVQAETARQAAAAKDAADAAEAEAVAEAERVATAKAKAARLRSQTSTTVARYTATTVASSPVGATGSLPPKYVSDCESGGNPRAVNPNGHYGKWQFSQSTWESVGGTGRPDQASEAEQDRRASILWDNGNGAGHWSCY